MTLRIGTLCFLVRGDEILLGMKKRGFGMGRWNGMGGKVRAGETVTAAALRELEEEVGVLGTEQDLEAMGVLEFRSENKDLNWDCHIFFLRTWKGKPVESEEMRPSWHDKNELPFELMWPDDKYWFPYLLLGKKIRAVFDLSLEGNEVLRYQIDEI